MKYKRFCLRYDHMFVYCYEINLYNNIQTVFSKEIFEYGAAGWFIILMIKMVMQARKFFIILKEILYHPFIIADIMHIQMMVILNEV